MKNCYALGLTLAFALGLSAAEQPTSGYRAEFLKELAGAEAHIVSLAETVPADKYEWSPAPGVRSIRQVFLHIASANFGLPNMIGTPPPAGFQNKGYEDSIKEKDAVVAELKKSFAHMRGAVLNLSDADAEKSMDWFGGKNTYRGFCMFLLRHLGEHTGQSIAYARMNGITPKWTEERMQQQQKAAPKPTSE